MAYRVFWTPNAEQKLDRILSRSRDASMVASAARELDKTFISAPLRFGESRSQGVRIGFERPLGVQFEVLEDVATVIVLDVWRTDRMWRT